MQAQLYRLTEHFLKMANLPSICSTAATELAVTDVVNTEKQAADKSISKVLYLNLCSQEIRRHRNLATPLVCTPSSPSHVPDSRKLEESSERVHISFRYMLKSNECNCLYAWILLFVVGVVSWVCTCSVGVEAANLFE